MKFTIPNQLTLIRIFLTPVFVFLFIDPDPQYRLIASIVFLIASLTDWYDGYIARKLHQVSRWGQFMDPLADKILVSSAMISVNADPAGNIHFAKWKTFLQMIFVFAVIIYLNIPGLPEIRLHYVENPWIQWTTIILAIVVVLTAISGIHYLVVNFSHIIELGRRIAKFFVNLLKTKK